MKKTLLIIVALLSVIATKAQITLNQSDFGNIYFNAIQANDTLIDTASIHIGGTGNQTWVFTGLHNHYPDSLRFMTVASTPYSSNFGAANIAFTKSNSPGVYSFLNASSVGVNIIGQGYNQGNFSLTTPNEAVILNPSQLYMPFPSTFNSGFSGSSMTTIVIDTTFTFNPFTVDTIHVLHYITDSSLIDAWGNLTTAFGTFQTLRQKYMEHTIDSIYVHTTTIGWQYSTINIVDSSLIYRWFANNQGYPIVEITMNLSLIH